MRIEVRRVWEFPLPDPANYYIIELNERLVLVDAGPRPLEESLASRAAGALITHWHWDHTLGLQGLRNKTICASRETLDMLSSEERILDSMLRPAHAMGLRGDGNLGLFEAMLGRYRSIINALSRNKAYTWDECPLLDEIGARVIPCPGHTMDHSCIIAAGTLFAGDTVTHPTPPTTIHYTHYVKSIVRLMGEAAWDRLAPGHGSVLERREAAEYLAGVLARKNSRLARIALSLGGEWATFNDILRRVYNIEPGVEAYVAARTLIGYLQALEDAGLVEVDRDSRPWRVRGLAPPA